MKQRTDTARMIAAGHQESLSRVVMTNVALEAGVYRLDVEGSFHIGTRAACEGITNKKPRRIKHGNRPGHVFGPLVEKPADDVIILSISGYRRQSVDGAHA